MPIRVKLGRGSSLRFLLSKKPTGPAQEQTDSITTERDAGLATVDRRDDYLVKKKKGTGITFYDLGQLDGSTIHVAEQFVFNNLNDATLTATWDMYDDTAKDDLISDLEGAIVAVPTEDWTTRFDKISKGELIEKGVFVIYTKDAVEFTGTLDASSQWTSGGLVLTDAETATLTINGVNAMFVNYGVNLASPDPSIKITDVYDIDAAPVSFTPASKMEVFLVPQLATMSALTRYYNTLHYYDDGMGTIVSDLISEYQASRPVTTLVPRTRFSDVLSLFNDAFEIGLYNFIKNLLVNLPEFEGYHGVRDFVETPPYAYSTVWSALSGGSFPFPTIYTPAGYNNTATVFNTEFGGGPVSIDFHKLIMVIRKAGTLYYFWRT